MIPSRSEFVLIGPHAAGKSTLARLLGARLGLPVVSLDAVKWEYFRALGCDEAEAARIRGERGFWAMTHWLQPWAIAMVERVLVLQFPFISWGRSVNLCTMRRRSAYKPGEIRLQAQIPEGELQY